MGADGYLTLSRVSSGFELISPDKFPFFRITEPTAILPVYVNKYGNSLSCTSHNSSIDYQVRWGDLRALIIGNYTGYIPYKISDLTKHPNLEINPKLWDSGALTREENESQWGQLKNGIWAATNYWRSGGSEDDYGPSKKDFAVPNGVTFDLEVKLHLWT